MPRPKGSYKYTDAQLIAALRKKHGLISQAAKMLRCNAQTIYNRMDTVPEVRMVIEECRSEVVDLAEEKLIKHIKQGNLKAVTYMLSTQGKNRGYVERTESRIGGDETAPPIQTEQFLDVSTLPLELRMALLEHIRQQEENGDKPQIEVINETRKPSEGDKNGESD